MSKPAPPGWKKTIDDLSAEIRQGKRLFVSGDEGDWARDYERSLLPPIAYYVAVGILFTVLTAIMTYPLMFQSGRSLFDLEDSLLNTWILTWDIRQILDLNWAGFFDANIFYPNTRVLAYSEHLFSTAILGLPIQWAFGNPVLTYNFTLLFSFILSGLGMTALTHRLTGMKAESVVAGIIFTFAPFKLGHLYHLQIYSSWTIPLSFLFYWQYLRDRRWRSLLLFLFFYLFQVLSNGYFALYLTFFLILMTGYFFSLGDKPFPKDFWVKSGVLILAVFLIAGPFYYQYAMVRREMGFIRSSVYSADLTSFLAVPAINKIYGRLLSPFLIQEGELFAGVVPYLLCGFGLANFLTRKKKEAGEPKISEPRTFVLKFLRFFDYFLLSGATLIFFTGGFKGTIWGIPVDIQIPDGLLAIAFLIFIIRVIVDSHFRKVVQENILEWRGSPSLKIYAVFLMLAFLFSLGPVIRLNHVSIFPWGPYLLLQWLPGFDGLRVSSRFYVFMLLALSLFAAIGLRRLSDQRNWPGWKRKTLLISAGALILLEFWSAPLPLKTAPRLNKIPEAYQWLSRQKGDFAVLELPLPRSYEEIPILETPRMFYSLVHGKKLFNGYSGYLAPTYEEMMLRFQRLGVPALIRPARELGIRYLLFHENEFEHKEWKSLMDLFPQMNKEVTFIGRQGRTYIFEINPFSPGPKDPIPAGPGSLPKKNKWLIRSDLERNQVYKAIDGNLQTIWYTGEPQRPGISLELDLRETKAADRVDLYLGRSYFNYPRGYLVEVSRDGLVWKQGANENEAVLPITAFLNPKQIIHQIPIKPLEFRFLRITLTALARHEWSVAEIGLHFINR